MRIMTVCGSLATSVILGDSYGIHQGGRETDRQRQRERRKCHFRGQLRNTSGGGGGERQTDRDREKDGSYITIVVLKWAMSSLFPFSKIYILRFATVKWSPCLWYQGAENYDDSHF